MTPTSEQIRLMLASQPDYPMHFEEWRRLDEIMLSQRAKHGAEATAWWFDLERARWHAIALRAEAA